MSYELYYTSARKGLKPGSSGFCTVGATDGIPPALQSRLESLSSFPSVRGATAGNSVSELAVYTHWRFGIGGRLQSILSRVAPSGLDDSRRLNTLAYHLVLAPSEQQRAGPARMMLQPGVLMQEWIGDPKLLPPRTEPVIEETSPRICRAWEEITGDAGWAGLVAQACAARTAVPIYLLCEQTHNLLPLLDEVISLLPASMRWGVTYNTCFTTLPAGLSCLVRCVLKETTLAKDILKRGAPGLLIDLTCRSGRAPETTAAHAARAGIAICLPGEPGDLRSSANSDNHA